MKLDNARLLATVATLPCGARISMHALASVNPSPAGKNHTGAKKQLFLAIDTSCHEVVENGLAACPRLKALIGIGRERNLLAIVEDIDKDAVDNTALPAVVGISNRKNKPVALRPVEVHCNIHTKPFSPNVDAKIDNADEKAARPGKMCNRINIDSHAKNYIKNPLIVSMEKLK